MPSNPIFNDEFYKTTLRIPGKTFLLGEYGALIGDAALLCATTPQFQARPKRESALVGIHPESPAGQLWKQSGSPFGVEFMDPFEGAGGFGASGAQFLAVYALLEFQKSAERLGPGSWASLLQCYREIVSGGDGSLSPSGADLVCQLTGGICYFHRQKGEVQVLSWPFEDVDFILFKTGGKVSTHDHVKHLVADHLKGLGALADLGFRALKDSSPESFVQAVTDMQLTLQSRGLTSKATMEILAELDKVGGVLASKGCGALGADVLAVFCEPEQKPTLVRKGEELGLKFMASRQEISPGLQWEWSLRSSI